MKTVRMREEMEAVNKVVEKERVLTFNLDKKDIEWENGPLAKEIERGRKNINNIDERKTKTLQIYKPYARFIMR